jgi:hypothetical protein
MARRIAAGALVGATVAACFAAPTRPGTGDGGPGGDARTDDGADALRDGPLANPDGDPLSCIVDDFLGTGSGTCGSSMWGNPSGAGSAVAYLTNTGTGELKLTNYGSPSGFILCLSQGMPWNRVIVDVAGIATSSTGDRTFVGLQSADGTEHWGVDFYDDGATGAYTPVCDDGGPVSIGMTSWSATAQRYIKVERTAAASISIFTSDNTTSFTEIDTCAPASAMLDTASVQLRVFKEPAVSGPSATATFRSIELCHD